MIPHSAVYCLANHRWKRRTSRIQWTSAFYSKCWSMETDIFSFYLMMSASSISRKTTERKQTFLFSQTRPCSVFFRQWFVGIEKLFQNNNSSKAFAAWRTRVSFIYFNKNDMECKKKLCCCFLCECVCVCVARIVFDPNGSHLFISCSIRISFLGIHKEYTKKRQNEWKKVCSKRKEASVFYLFSFILACNLAEKNGDETEVDVIHSHAILASFFPFFLLFRWKM